MGGMIAAFKKWIKAYKALIAPNTRQVYSGVPGCARKWYSTSSGKTRLNPSKNQLHIMGYQKILRPCMCAHMHKHRLPTQITQTLKGYTTIHPKNKEENNKPFSSTENMIENHIGSDTLANICFAKAATSDTSSRRQV